MTFFYTTLTESQKFGLKDRAYSKVNFWYVFNKLFKNLNRKEKKSKKGFAEIFRSEIEKNYNFSLVDFDIGDTTESQLVKRKLHCRPFPEIHEKLGIPISFISK